MRTQRVAIALAAAMAAALIAAIATTTLRGAPAASSAPSASASPTAAAAPIPRVVFAQSVVLDYVPGGGAVTTSAYDSFEVLTPGGGRQSHAISGIAVGALRFRRSRSRRVLASSGDDAIPTRVQRSARRRRLGRAQGSGTGAAHADRRGTRWRLALGGRREVADRADTRRADRRWGEPTYRDRRGERRYSRAARVLRGKHGHRCALCRRAGPRGSSPRVVCGARSRDRSGTHGDAHARAEHVPRRVRAVRRWPRWHDR